MSEGLKKSAGVPGTVSNITAYHDEIENLITGPTVGGLDIVGKHLEDFLIRTWEQTDLAGEYDIYEEDGEYVGQQYLTDTGAIDILAISKDKKTLKVDTSKKSSTKILKSRVSKTPPKTIKKVRVSR